MGDFTGTVPTFAAGAKVRGVDLQTLADVGTALTATWTTWTPILTNLTQGNGTIVSQYRRLGKTVDFVFRFVFGSAGSAVGTDPSFSLPATPATHYVEAAFGFVPVGPAYFLDSGTTTRSGILGIFSGSTARLMYDNGTSPAVSITATVPWTWAVGDVLAGWGTYQTT